MHKRVHSELKEFCCSICSKYFSLKLTLKVHIRTHTREKPFSCSECNHSFFLKGSLVAHMRIHSGEKPFSCPTCKESFSLKHSLKNHTKDVHFRLKEFSCKICSKHFSRKESLKGHIRTQHNKNKGKAWQNIDIELPYNMGKWWEHLVLLKVWGANTFFNSTCSWKMHLDVGSEPYLSKQKGAVQNRHHFHLW